MKTEKIKSSGKRLVKKCHVCGHIMEKIHEPEKCASCMKPFLPSNYFGKVHAKNSEEFGKLFSHCDDLHEDDLVKGINVLW